MRKKLAAIGTAAALLVGGAVTATPAQAGTVRKCVMNTPYSTTFFRVTNDAGGSTILQPGQKFCAYNFAGLVIAGTRDAHVFKTSPGNTIVYLKDGRYPSAIRGSLSTEHYVTVYKR